MTHQAHANIICVLSFIGNPAHKMNVVNTIGLNIIPELGFNQKSVMDYVCRG